ncbi:MAG: iron hydrogenase small subunit, partial [Butyricicoccus pullicaecorum]|nr:iron hydrogenase small subunit [Butyricicoccus pullicaecorum]
LHVGEHELNVAVVYGTANARTLIERMKNGGKQYHFIEVMACPGGCIGGDGQPKDLLKDADQIRQSRISGLYARDASLTVRKSHENPDIKLVYEQFYGQPLSEMAEKMLHTIYTDRSNTLHVERRTYYEKVEVQSLRLHLRGRVSVR